MPWTAVRSGAGARLVFGSARVITRLPVITRVLHKEGNSTGGPPSFNLNIRIAGIGQ